MDTEQRNKWQLPYPALNDRHVVSSLCTNSADSAAVGGQVTLRACRRAHRGALRRRRACRGANRRVHRSVYRSVHSNALRRRRALRCRHALRRRRVDGEAELEEKRAQAGARAAAGGVEDHEALKARAVVRELAHAVEHEVDDLLADGVVATRVVVRRVLLAGDDLLGVVELAVRAGAHLVADGGLEGGGGVGEEVQIEEDGEEGRQWGARSSWRPRCGGWWRRSRWRRRRRGRWRRGASATATAAAVHRHGGKLNNRPEHGLLSICEGGAVV